MTGLCLSTNAVEFLFIKNVFRWFIILKRRDNEDHNDSKSSRDTSFILRRDDSELVKLQRYSFNLINVKS
jgi:hypothetical protein